jgi:hypothetical protein
MVGLACKDSPETPAVPHVIVGPRAVSDDGQRVVYGTRVDGAAEAPIWLAHLGPDPEAGRVLIGQLDPLFGGITQVFLLPDDGGVGFVKGGDLFLRRFGSDEDSCVLDLADDISEVAWCPGGGDPLVRFILKVGVYRANLGTGEVTRVGSPLSGLDPRWMPSGDAFVYVDRVPGTEMTRHVYMADPSGQVVADLTPGEDYCWRPTLIEIDRELYLYFLSATLAEGLGKKTTKALRLRDGIAVEPAIQLLYDSRSTVVSSNGRFVAYTRDGVLYVAKADGMKTLQSWRVKP